MDLDYKAIGKRICQYRKAEKLSQQELAEQVNISVTHMSNIETGNTKVSLIVLVGLADALSVGIDDLLERQNFCKTKRKEKTREEIMNILAECNERDLAIMQDAMKEIRVILEKCREDDGEEGSVTE